MTMINTVADLLRALDENPAFYEAVRSRILGDALLQLPAKFDAFQQEMTTFVAEQRDTNAELRAATKELRAFNEEQRVINEEQRAINANFNARQDRMEGDISTLKAFFARMETVQNGAEICEALGLDYVATLSRADLSAMARGALSRPEFISFSQADLVVSATDAGNLAIWPWKYPIRRRLETWNGPPATRNC